MHDTDVVVAGAGPVGMTLALELAHQGISVVLLEQNLSTTPYPKMEVINGRTLELFRRHCGGRIVDAIRDHGQNPDDAFIKEFVSPKGTWLIVS